MILDNKKDFFEATKPVFEDVEVKDGVFIRVSEMTATDFVTLWTDPAYQVDGKEGVLSLQKITPALIVGSVVNEKGDRLFSDKDTVDLERKVGSAIFLKLGAAARRLNGVSGTEEKNSEASPAEDSSTGSPSN